MAQPVWVLSVDLQAKTAAFQSGLSDAARAARGSFGEIGDGAGRAGRSVGYSMGEARHSVMLLGEEFGVHLPRALTTFIAGLGPIGAALEAAFPFLAIAVGATLLIEHLEKMHEAGEKLTLDQVRFGTAVNTAFNSLDEKIIQAKIRSDELRNDHLGALKLQLELIDHQSMAELLHNFETLAKAADVVMKDLEGHWYTFGRGSDGAKHALDDFQVQYQNLLSAGKQEQASGLLHGTLTQAQQVLQALRDKQTYDNASSPDDSMFQKHIAAEQTLKKIHVETGLALDNQIAGQQNLVEALNAQAGAEQRIAEIKKISSGNATRQTGNEDASRRAAAARQVAESQLRMGEQSIAADRATAEAALSAHRASLEERLATDLDFAGRDRDVKQAANQAEIAALDKGGKDYQNQLEALQDRALEINQEYDTKTAELRAKASIDTNSRDLRDLEQSEREKIEATQQGSAARLAVINAALREEESRGLQDTAFYRELLNARVQTARQEAEEEGKLKAEAAREEADNDEKMGQLAISAEKQQMALMDSARRVTVEQRIAEDTRIANEEYAIKMAAFQKELQGLDKSGKDYQNRLEQLQDKEKQLTQQHENELTAIKEKAAEDSNQRVLSSYEQFVNATSQSLTQSIMGHQTWARMLQSLGDQVVSGMMQNAIKSVMMDDFDKEHDAAKAARKFFLAGAQLPFPVNVIAAPAMAAGAFAAVMAFQGGTESVPGVGRGDVVPAMLTPGEGVVPGGVMDGLRNIARNGGFEQRPGMTVHVRPVYNVNTIDGDGMRAALEKHTDQLQRHFENTLRKLNR